MSQFLNLRNTVAHGGDIDSVEKVTHDVYKKYKQLVVDLMYEIYKKVSEGIESKKYMRKG